MLPMLQAEAPVSFGSDAGGGASRGAAVAAAGAAAPAAFVSFADLLEDADTFLCEAAVGDDSYRDFWLGPCDLQLGDTWGGMQNKMSVAAPIKKIRKKSDSKPQSQINKCNNEKRRRELENETIDQLEELLGACLSDVRQPDKNGIVQEAAAQIRRVLDKRRADAAGCCSACPPACIRACCHKNNTALQQVPDTTTPADVTSSQQLPDSEITALIEALKHYTNSLGWVLLEINADGDIECVTENIKDLIRWERSELCKQSIYSYLHHGDHHKFVPILQNVSSISWPGGGEGTRKFRAIKSRLLLKEAGGSASDNGGPPSYVEVLISAALVRGEAEGAASVMCVIRRCDDASAAALALQGDASLPPKTLDQITFKLDLSGFIITCDLNGALNSLALTPPVAINLARSLEGRRLSDLCAVNDVARLNNHLREAPAPPAPPAFSSPLRFRFSPDRPWLTIRSYSRLFRSNPITGEPDFIMSTHAVFDDERSAADPPPGGPLMTSALLNGTARNGQYRSTGPTPDPTSFSFGQDLDLVLDYPQSAWADCDGPTRSPNSGYGSFPFSPLPLEENKDCKESIATTPGSTMSGSGGGVTSNERPHTPRTPHTPHTPHTPLSASGSAPPSVTAPPPAPSPDANKLRTLLSKRPGSPAVSVSTAPSTPVSTPDQPASANLILKGLLHQKDDDQSSSPSVPVSLPSASTAQSHHPQHQQHKPHTNNMLLALLQEKSDDDDAESRSSSSTAQRSRSELLTQLLKTDPNSNGGDTSGNPTNHDASDELFSMLGISGQNRKRKLDESIGPMSVGKRISNDTQVTSSATPVSSTSAISSSGLSIGNNNPASKQRRSKLLEKNQLLASLLEKQPSAPTTPLPSPNPVLNRPFHENRVNIRTTVPNPRPATHPNIALSHILNNNKANINNSPYDGQQQQQLQHQQQQQALTHLQQVLQAGSGRGVYSPSAQPQFCPSLPPRGSLPVASQASPQTSQTSGGSPTSYAGQQQQHHDFRTQEMRCVDPSGDRLLSDILDEVMDIVPEPVAYGSGGPGTPGAGPESPAPDQLIGLLGNVEMPRVVSARQPSPGYQGMNEKMAINAIQKVLMQCESAVKSPVSPGVPPVYPTPNTTLYSASGASVGNSIVCVGDSARQRILAAHAQRARLLQAQRGQQLLVPTAAEQPTTDIHSTMDALLSVSTPPNVSLQRAPVPHASHQHQQQQQQHRHHQTQMHHQQQYHHQVVSSVNNAYGNNGKLTPQQQQNPMLSAQLTGGYVNTGGMAAGGAAGGGAGSPQAGLAPPHAPLAPHTPLTAQHAPPSPYHQRPPPPPHPHHPPRPHPGSYYGGGPGGGGGGPGGDAPPYAPSYDRPLYPHHHHLSGSVSGSSASEYVRQELRAVVGARTGVLHSAPLQGGPQVPNTAPPNQGMHLAQGVPRPTDPGLVSPADLDALGLSFEMPTAEYYGGGGR